MNMLDQYYLQQVCLNGHQITSSYKDRMLQMPFSAVSRTIFCDKCGEQTVTQCTYCKCGIRGRDHSIAGAMQPVAVPAYCRNCGKAYPWTETKIQTAVQIFAEFGQLDAEEKKCIENDIKNVARDVPQSELSAMRIKKLWEKYGKIAYNIIMEFATKTTAEILKNP